MADPASKFPSLTVLGGEKAGTQFVIEEAVDNILIGSDPSCRFCLSSPGVSPVHARIWVDENGLTLYDTHSPRGLYVNDDKVANQIALHNGDIIWLGAPGDDQAVMIQCRVPPREGVVEAAAETAPPPEAPTQATPMEPQTLALPHEAYAPAQPEPVADSDFAAEPEAVPASPAPAHPAEFESELEEAHARPAAPPVSAAPAPSPTPATPPPPQTPKPAPPAAAPSQPRPAPVQQVPRSGLTPVPGGQQAARAGLTPVPAQQPPAARPQPARVAHPTPVPGHPRRPAPSAHAHPAPRAAKGGSKGLWIALAVLVLLGAAGAGGYLYLAGRTSPVVQTAPTPAPPTPAPEATPQPSIAQATPTETPAPEATPEPVEVVTIVKPGASPTAPATPSPTKTPKPTPTAKPTGTPAPKPGIAPAVQQTASRVAALVTQAETAMAADRFDAAVGLYEEALKLDPQNAQALSGKADAAAAASAYKRTFVVARTTVQAGKGGSKNLQGFESEGVTVAKAPDYSGVLDFDVSPAHVKPGTNLTIRMRLGNDGKKSYRIASIDVATTVNGERSSTAAPPPSRELEPKQTVNIGERSVAWAGTTKSWQFEVTVKTTRGDTFTNRVTWR
jgi:hypothetical protein